MSRHAAASARRAHSVATSNVSAAELIARYRVADSATAGPIRATPPTLEIATPAPTSTAIPASGPVSAAELIARHQRTTSGPGRAADRARSHARSRREDRPSVFGRSNPVKVVARPLLVAAAVIATVAGIDAAHVPTTRAAAEQPVSTTASGAASAGNARTAAGASGPSAGSTGSASSGATTASSAGSSGSGSAAAGSSGAAAGSAGSGSSTSAGSSGATTGAGTSVATTDGWSAASIGVELPKSSGSGSRLKRTANTPKLLTKPGQTVAGVWVKPNTGPMTSCFCERWGEMHWGIDLAGPLGSPILAVGDGVVLEAGPADGFGNWVVIQHSNGDVSIYGHMQYYFVHKGQKIKAGQKIALVGDEGQSTGPHLHFEVHRGGLTGVKIDPVPWLKARGISVGPYLPND